MKKQKIVIQMQLSRDKDRSKAMQIASCTKGVISVAIKGDGKDQVEVIGEEIDSVELTKSIRRRVSKYASIQSVEEVKPKEEEKKAEKPLQWAMAPPVIPTPYYCQPVYDSDPRGCSIL
ncbi:heavy metal-associated isoprenylated plant protein 16-like [Camellia sinensis]|uniref:heavy metal-associated isoprenylated plant protein 16-like n=1 Tax=Camellia sinensis TaxID=4442 RepID=UPI001036BEA5|nr:heavy metal-associated isoprenylated plant protein 16-like [Camellia sinensis]